MKIQDFYAKISGDSTSILVKALGKVKNVEDPARLLHQHGGLLDEWSVWPGPAVASQQASR